MNKAKYIFNKLAEKKKKKDKSGLHPAYPIGVAAGAAVGGLSHTYRKPTGVHSVRMPDKEVTKFIKKLQPGDVMTTGAYNTGGGNVFQMALGRNQKQYHSGVYLGRGQMTDMLPHMSTPRSSTNRSNIRDFKNVEAFKAHRPKGMSKSQRKRFAHDVAINQRKYVYDNKGSAKALVSNKIQKILPTRTLLKVLPKKTGDKLFGCTGKFCSNLGSSHLPQKLFKTHKTVAMPADYWNPKYFKPVAELNKSTGMGHLALSNKSLIKYIAKPALAVGGAVAVADMLGVI